MCPFVQQSVSVPETERMLRSLLSFLNLAELGVGNAMLFSMYKPPAEDIPQDVNLYILYFVNRCIIMLTYWLYAYRTLLHLRIYRLSASMVLKDAARPRRFIMARPMPSAGTTSE